MSHVFRMSALRFGPTIWRQTDLSQDPIGFFVRSYFRCADNGLTRAYLHMVKKRSKLSRPNVAKEADPQPSDEAQSSAEGPVCSLEEREHMISEAAYFRAEQRGFADGN